LKVQETAEFSVCHLPSAISHLPSGLGLFSMYVDWSSSGRWSGLLAHLACLPVTGVFAHLGLPASPVHLKIRNHQVHLMFNHCISYLHIPIIIYSFQT
jgi:hypothetical protein